MSKLILEYRDRASLTPYGNNARTHSKEQIAEIVASIQEFGFTNPILIDPDGEIIAGHGRLEAAEILGLETVPVIPLPNLTAEQKRAYILADNQLAQKSGWDINKLIEEMQALAEAKFDVSLIGFSKQQTDDLIAGMTNAMDDMAAKAKQNFINNSHAGVLVEKFMIPPFSVMNAREGWWQKRKKAWIGIGIKSEIGRGENAMNYGLVARNPHFYHLKDHLEKLEGRELSHAEVETVGKKHGLWYEYAIGFTEENKTADRTQNQENAALFESIYTADPHFYRKKKDLEAELGKEITSAEAAEILGERGQLGTNIATGEPAQVSGTSIFDPVLTELLVRWFSPVGGLILDPFAGGSVRGAVSGVLGRSYIGVDLREEQAIANRAQCVDIQERIVSKNDIPGMKKVKVSAKMANLLFHPCEPDYIKNVCKASCCQSSVDPSGIVVTIHPSEEQKVIDAGGVVKDGLLQSVKKRCPFKNGETELCGLHGTDAKPFGCIASPFNLNQNDTMIVRNRYRMLKCFKDEGALPAYVSFRASLDLIFGAEESERICNNFAQGGGDIEAYVSEVNYKKLKDNDAIKKHEALDQDKIEQAEPKWITGDSREIDKHCEGVQADFMLSCPPYADLEVYSDDPKDLSNLAYNEFRPAYMDIIKKACALLKENSFAAFVVGEVRGPDGTYYNFVNDTIMAFKEAGLKYYNEAILITAVGSLPIRAARQFSSGRKLGKTHQNILVFVKGDGKLATERCGPVEVGGLEGILEDEG